MKLTIKHIFLLLAWMMLASSTMIHAAQSVIFPQKLQPGTAQGMVKGNSYTLKNQVLSTSFNLQGGKLWFGGCPALGLLPQTEAFYLILGDSSIVKASEMKVKKIQLLSLSGDKKAATASLQYPGKAVEAQLSYKHLSIVWRAILRDDSHYLRTELFLSTTRPQAMKGIMAMNYRVEKSQAYTVPSVIGNTRGALLASNHIFAGLETPMGINECKDSPKENFSEIEGLWRRNTTLNPGDTWQVSAVVGLVAKDQLRRSFLAYSERERAVAWRPYPVYISWYELNIDRNNAEAPDYKGNMTVAQCTDVVKHWESSFYNKYQLAPKAFVWDDGWDQYGTWTFNLNFPNGFAEPAQEASKMKAGIGAWLGPVGGYGMSGEYRRAYWKDQGGMQLSNKPYYDYFIRSCTNMIDKYDFRFFKLDGISAQFSSVGPDDGTIGEENAEAIISIEKALRQKRPDIFLNTTVGTWASPFWFHFTDAVWRQEGDYGEVGDQGTDRERWITYRDRLVYQNFVQNSPICPINTLMTHGFILTRFGAVSKDMDYEGIVREMRCAFACGSGMVELYNDYKLMDEIKDKEGHAGALWKDLAECMRWQQEQADVLPDIHWVGGNPWDGKKANVYGWAAWNGSKAVLTLRNPATYEQNFTTTLRKALDIPAYVHGKIKLTNAFTQPELKGISINQPIDIDEELTLQMPASSVFVFNGKSLQATHRKHLSPTPPMGWMTWNMFKGDISDQLIRETADAMVEKGFLEAGYKYIFIDDLWQGGRDIHNNMIPNPEKFPNGIKAVADYVHSKGLKLGIYSDAAQLTCGGWTASYGFEEQDARTFASWGIDYLKYDYCNAPEDSATARTRYHAMADALSKSGRDIVLGICEWGQRKGEEWCEQVGGQLWRTSYDVRDMWKDTTHEGGMGILDIINISAPLAKHARPEQWMDMDMLVVGLNGKGGPSSDLGGTGCTYTEYQTQMSMWCMLSSVLALSNDLRKLTPEDCRILLNKEIIAINQDPLAKAAERKVNTDTHQIYVRPLADGSHAVAVLNFSDKPLVVNTTFKALGLNGKYIVRDVWLHRNIAQNATKWKGKLMAHETKVFILK